jgi:phage nucleotide-binding protein
MQLIKKPHEIEPVTTIRMLVYGQPGIGKTTLALSAPDCLLLDFDKGAHRVKQQHLHDTVQVKSWSEVCDVVKHLQENPRLYKTLVIDTAGKMLDHMSDYLIKSDPKNGKRDGSLSLQGYGARKTMFSRFISTISLLGKHIVFVAHEKEEKEGDNRVLRPEIGGSSSVDLIKELDLVGYMEAHGKKRTISFDPCERYYGKNTCSIEEVIHVVNAENKTDNNLLETIFSKYEDAIKERAEQMKKYNQLVSDYSLKASLVKNAKEANEFVTLVNSEENIWDSKNRAGLLIRDRAKGIGLVFDKELKVYSDPITIETSVKKEEKPLGQQDIISNLYVKYGIKENDIVSYFKRKKQDEFDDNDVQHLQGIYDCILSGTVNASDAFKIKNNVANI